MIKADLRDEMRRKRARMDARIRTILSDAICNRLIACAFFDSAISVASYASVQTEVDTRRIMQVALSHGKQVSVPISGPGGAMVFQRIFSPGELRPARFDLLEPQTDVTRQVGPDTLDLVLVPGIGFDRQGNRLGSGGGYYDRFLGQCPALRVGLAFGIQIAEALPCEPHDVAMDWLVTDEALIECRAK
jgi:5-formyltetrahydrofolate cyclo-ligase